MDVEEDRNQQGGRSRRKKAQNFGDENFAISEVDEYDEAEWGEIANCCCSHSPDEWGKILLGIVLMFFFVYWFLFSLELLGTGAKVLSGCRGGLIFGANLNPLSAVMVASLATCLLQSSSTTTAIIVHLVGDEAISVQDGVYLVMGANIGTAITNNIVALAQISNVEEFERAFSAACLHDIFNIFTVVVLLPLEVLTGYLEFVTKLIVEGAETKDGEEWEGPMSKLVKPLTQKLIISNKKAIIRVAEGEACEEFYPVTCDEGFPESYKTCDQGFVGCDKATGECPAWFREGASLTDDKVAGGVSIFMGLLFGYVCVIGMMAVAQWLLKGLTTRVVYTVANAHGYVGIAVGAGLTMFLQSSSLTTSLLTPWVGIGVLRLEQMYPLTLGANIGTTLSAILAALVTRGLDPLQVALAHLFFNITGVLIWYPIPHLRQIPIFVARRLGRMVALWRPFSIIYLFMVFFLIPSLILGLSELLENDKKAAGGILIALVCAVVVVGSWWFYCRGGGTKVADAIEAWKNRGHNDVSPMSGGSTEGEEEALTKEDDAEEEA